MKITCAVSPPPVGYKGKDGKTELLVIRPGSHNYPQLQPSKDPELAEQLRVLRKLHRISFDDLLLTDREALKSCPKSKKPVDHLAEKVLQRPTMVGRVVNEKTKERKDAEAKEAKEKDARRRKKDSPKASAAKQNTDNSGKPGDVSNKK